MRRASNCISPTRPGQKMTELFGRRRSRRESICSRTADLQPISRNGHGCSLQYAYGKFLAFLSARHSSLLARAPAERLNRKIIEAYVRWQPASCGGITIAIYLYHLWLTLRYICPSEDWSWLLTISKRIAAQAKQKPEKHHLVTSETLYALGIELMDRAITNGNAAKNMSMARCN